MLGGGGMLGHKMYQVLLDLYPDTGTTLVGPLNAPHYQRVELFRRGRVFDRVDALDERRVESLLNELRPEFVVNCVGLVKQRPEACSPLSTIALNALLPHRLARSVERWSGRVIHFSTDCVFSGRKGQYSEDDPSDAEDLYGRSKSLGELRCANALTLRTSIVGRELSSSRSLLEWFSSNRGGTVRGFTRVMYSGVTTNYLASTVARLIGAHPNLSGLYQLASKPISKHDLLSAFEAALGLDVNVVPDDTEVSDRTLLGTRFERATGIQTPSWGELITGLAADPTPYAKWRGGRAGMQGELAHPAASARERG